MYSISTMDCKLHMKCTVSAVRIFFWFINHFNVDNHKVELGGERVFSFSFVVFCTFMNCLQIMQMIRIRRWWCQNNASSKTQAVIPVYEWKCLIHDVFPTATLETLPLSGLTTSYTPPPLSSVACNVCHLETIPHVFCLTLDKRINYVLKLAKQRQ